MSHGGGLSLNTAELQLARMKAAEQNQHIQVFVRVRPVNAQERAKNPYVILDCPGTREVVVKERSVSLAKTFTFDRVFGPNSKQIEVYRSVVFPLLEEVLLGYNCTVFAYGQTGTGKTFTMEGERSDDLDLPWETDPKAGIIPRALSQLFDELRLQEAEFTVRVSLLEVYNEELFDLLSPAVPTEEGKQKPSLRLFEDSNRKGSVIIQGLEELTVHNKHEVYRIMKQGTERRRTASTQMNANSSRSHTIFTVTVHIKEVNVEGEELVKIGKLNLVDLAGSENIGRSGSVNKHAREAGSINQSLLTLGRVITALVEHTPHIPYRESKLTRLLQDSLGGRTKTSIIATVSPAAVNLEETLSTLDYAHRAKDITNRPEVNQKMTKRAVLKEYTEEIERLRKDLNACREKNGVFMDKENHTQMLNELESQRQEINEKVLLTRTLEETIQKKDEDYKKLEADLEEVQDHLTTCNTILAQTEKALYTTREELELVRLDRDKKSHLVKNHVKTERKLTAEAGQLLTTADDATSNLEKMYRTLDRKMNVEQKNLEAGNQFQNSVTQGLSDVYDSIETFRVNHSSFCGTQRLALETLLTEKEPKIAELKKVITAFVDNISKFEMKDHANSMVLTSRKWNKENVQQAENVNEAYKNGAAESLGKIIGLSKQLGLKVNEISSIFEKTLKEWDETVKEQIQSGRDFVNTNLDLLHAFHKQYIAEYQEQNKREEQLRSLILKQDELRESQSQMFTSSLDTLIKNYETFQDQMSSNSVNLMANVKDSVKGAKGMINLVTTNNGAVDMKSEKLLAFLANKAETVVGRVKMTENELKDMQGAAGDTIKAMDLEVQEHFEMTVASLKEFEEGTKSRFNDNDKELDVLSSKFDQLNEKLQTETSREMGILEEKLNIVEKNEDEAINLAVTALGDHCEDVSAWAEKVGEETIMQASKVDDFWGSIYLRDRPTGATPQRKAYVYPRLLSATSPHERIVSRFLDRLQKKKNDENHNDPNETF